MTAKNQKNDETAKDRKPEIDVNDVIKRLKLKKTVALNQRYEYFENLYTNLCTGKTKSMTRIEYRAYVQHIGPIECRKCGKAVNEMKTDWGWKKKCTACADTMKAAAAEKKAATKKAA